MITYNDHLSHLNRGTRQAAQEVAESANADAAILDYMLDLESVIDHSWTRRCIALNPNLSKEGFERLAADHDEAVRQSLVHNPSITGEILTLLYEDTPGRFLVQTIAAVPTVPVEVQKDMAEHHVDNDWVMKALAMNPNLDASVVPTLVVSKNDFIRKEVARRHLLTLDQQFVLARDENHWVRSALGANSSVEVQVLDYIARNDDNGYVRKAVAGNRSTAQETLALLAGDENYHVRNAARRNRNLAG